MKPRHQRALLVLASLAALAIAVALVLQAFKQNLVFFYTPTQVLQGEASGRRALRIGGLVEAGSVQRRDDGVWVDFIVSDGVARLPVAYRGALPDLFREGKGVVAQGRLGSDGRLVADQVLAKHDENYMPPEAAESLRQAAAGRQPNTERPR